MKYFTYAFMAVVLLAPSLGWNADLGTKKEQELWFNQLIVKEEYGIDVPESEKERLDKIKSMVDELKASDGELSPENEVMFIALADVTDKTPVEGAIWAARKFLAGLYTRFADHKTEFAYRGALFSKLRDNAEMHFMIGNSIVVHYSLGQGNEHLDNVFKETGLDVTSVRKDLNSTRQTSCEILNDMKEQSPALFKAALPNFDTQEVRQRLIKYYGNDIQDYSYKQVVKACL